ncbi:S8 family peptidase [Adlercreutzia sp. R21]|uniref:S8 family peptidase n=1 Tax=Adlercreutzia wanghongyangiae TaxID=3111451 RepID=UPI002DBC34CE|nr:S8 family peptidase [Adlercreutzia sp. R21]MEC4183774.1 S8 family peptidase [Adlercreutzia sp. R21]
MTNLLSMGKGLYHRRRSADAGGGISMGASDALTAAHIRSFKSSLEKTLANWPEKALVEDILVDVWYDTIVSKTNRLHLLLKERHIDDVHGVVGARYEMNDLEQPCHVLTYYVTRDAIKTSLENLDAAIRFLQSHFGEDALKKATFDKIGETLDPPKGWSKTRLQQLLHDCIHAVRATVPHFSRTVDGDSLVAIFPTELTARSLLAHTDETNQPGTIIDDTTLLLSPDQLSDLAKRAPYLITMTCGDEFDAPEALDDDWGDSVDFDIPQPTSEPTVGVIDTLFNKDSLLSDWVDYRPAIPEDLPIAQNDFEHGTRVSSIIVAGHKLNPELDDGCGWFQVRHFGAALAVGNSTTRLIRDIRSIVEKNPDIRVWNLSLGYTEEVPPNVISPLAACLDDLQSERDILFVVAGTNDKNRTRRMRIGSPADSVNSIVVNSIRSEGGAATYSRRGPVLSFFTKPDVAARGGDAGEKVTVLDSFGVTTEEGTSFAAPWITRKAAYLMEVMHLPRDVAKALIIDSAISWNADALEKGITAELGYGAVPVSIDDLVTAGKDEIRFYLSGRARNYETYTRGVPVPLLNDKYPYVARAVLSYAPVCDKRQGVDYTNTELSLAFGRQQDKRNNEGISRIVIHPIADKFTSAPTEFVPFEAAVRKFERKWDNVKIHAESFERSRPKKRESQSGYWGLSLKKTDRLNDGSGNDIPFGVVVTLRSLDGKNRIEDFIQQSINLGWDVREITVEEKLRISIEAQEEITFE